MKNKKDVVSEVNSLFKKIWESNRKKDENNKESFDQLFLRLFKKIYDYESEEINTNKNKYFILKGIVLVIIASIPFLILGLLSNKQFILGENEWNDVYLYTIILVPVAFAFLLSKYIDAKQYRELWMRHTKSKDYMDWRMMMFVKDYETKKMAVAEENAPTLLETLKAEFIDDMCKYWNASTTEFIEKVMAKDENIFQEIGRLIG